MTVNNIINLDIEEVIFDGSINFGNAVLKGLNANSKQIGGQSVFGDLNSSAYAEANNVGDPDVLDQPSVQF